MNINRRTLAIVLVSGILSWGVPAGVAAQEQSLEATARTNTTLVRRDAVHRERWALIVGVSEYKDPGMRPLRYADRDALALAEFLQTPAGGGYRRENILLLTNDSATTANVTAGLRSFLQKPQKEDIVLIYFAGHGAPEQSNLYLLTHDTRADDLAGTAVPMRELELSLEHHVQAERVMVLVDACYSAGIGAGTRVTIDETRELNEFLRRMEESRPTVGIISSAAENQVASESAVWGGGHGVFTHFLLEGLKGRANSDADDEITFQELFEYVSRNVRDATGNAQHPQNLSHEGYAPDFPLAYIGVAAAEAHSDLGQRLHELGLVTREQAPIAAAARQFGHAQRNFPRSVEIAAARARAFLALGADSAAIRVLRGAGSDGLGEATEALRLLGIAQALVGASDSAAQTFGAALRLDASQPDAPLLREYVEWQRTQGGRAPRRRALLVGIDQYRDEKLPQLAGAVNDAEILAAELVASAGFAAEDVRVVRNESATRESLLAELKELAQVTGPSDVVLIHYSGVGFGPDIDPATNALVLHETPFDGEGGITDAEFHGLLKKISAGSLIVSFDGMPSERWYRWVEEEAPYTLLAASAADQVVHEFPGEFRSLVVQPLESTAGARARPGRSIGIGTPHPHNLTPSGDWQILDGADPAAPPRRIAAAPEGFDAMAVSPDGTSIAGVGDEYDVLLWTPASGDSLRPLYGHSGAITSLAFSPDGKTLVSTSRDGTARVWELASGASMLVLRDSSDAPLLAAAWRPDGERLATAAENGRVALWDPVTGGIERILDAGRSAVHALAFGPDGRTLVTAGADSTARLWDAESGTPLRHFPHPAAVTSLAHSPRGDVFATGAEDGRARVWDTANGTVRATFQWRYPHVSRVGFSTDGQHLLYESWGTLSSGQWSFALGESLRDEAVGERTVAELFESASSRVISRTSGQQNPRLLGRRTGEPAFALWEPLRSVFSLLVRPLQPRLTVADLTSSYEWVGSRAAAVAPVHRAFAEQFLERGAFGSALEAYARLESQGGFEGHDRLGRAYAYAGAQEHGRAAAEFRTYRETAQPSGALRRALEHAAASMEARASGRRHALIVGVSGSEPGPATLDARAVRRALIQTQGFAPEDVRILTDSAATRANIMMNFRELVQKSRTQPALFYYAGPGSTLRGSRALTIVPVDGREPGVGDIALEELAAIAPAESTNLVAIFDAFTGTRMIAPDTSALRRGRGFELAGPLVTDLRAGATPIGFLTVIAPLFGYDEAVRGQPLLPAAERVVVIEGDSVDHGRLTWALVERLEASASLTYRTLLEGLGEAMLAPDSSDGAYPAAPTVLGAAHDEPVFGYSPRSTARLIGEIRDSAAVAPIEGAIVAVQRMIDDRRGDFPDGLLNLGIAHTARRRWPAGVAALERATEQLSDPVTREDSTAAAEAYRHLGRARLSSGLDLSGAVSALRTSIALSPSTAESYYWLGEALLALIQTETTLEARRALELYLAAGDPLGRAAEVEERLQRLEAR